MTRRRRIALIDQRDSFVHNLEQLLREDCGADVTLLSEEALGETGLTECFDGLILSPGPGVVAEHRPTMDFLHRWRATEAPLPLLGVCMGHQELGSLFGMELYPLTHPQHGVRSEVRWRSAPLPPMQVGRYHSWALRETEASRAEVEVLGESTEDGVVMAIGHRHLPAVGLQFHPESVLTPDGALLLRRWLEQGRL